MVLGLSVGILLTSSCQLDEVPNPNGPTLGQFSEGATEADLRLLAAGLSSVMRNDMEFYYQTVSIVGREYYDLTNTDPRYTGELLGAQGAPLDNNGFLTTRAYAANYKVVRNAYLLEQALDNSSTAYTQAELNAYYGYAKTIRAYAMLLLLNRQYQNGIRVDTRDPENLGPIVSYNEAMTTTMNLLNEAATELENASDEFDFIFSGLQIDGVDGPAAFLQVNRALAARVALYQGNNTMALSVLGDSFFDLGGDLDDGFYHVFGQGGNDIANPLFYVADQDLYGVQDDFTASAEAGDDRVATKTRAFGTSIGVDGRVTADGLSSSTQVSLYSSLVDEVPVIRNEELILIYAEANIGTDNTEAVNAINVIRNAAGLADYAGATDNASLLNEVVQQRRYSLFGEGHRWIDLRRLDRLDEIVIDRAGSVVHVQFPTPILEEGGE